MRTIVSRRRRRCGPGLEGERVAEDGGAVGDLDGAVLGQEAVRGEPDAAPRFESPQSLELCRVVERVVRGVAVQELDRALVEERRPSFQIGAHVENQVVLLGRHERAVGPGDGVDREAELDQGLGHPSHFPVQAVNDGSAVARLEQRIEHVREQGGTAWRARRSELDDPAIDAAHAAQDLLAAAIERVGDGGGP